MGLAGRFMGWYKVFLESFQMVKFWILKKFLKKWKKNGFEIIIWNFLKIWKLLEN